MEIIASLLRDLGFENVVGILDENKNEVMRHLSDVFPKYHFVTIPANDVRTKPAVPAKDGVVGVVDEAGDVRPEYKQTLSELFDLINEKLRSDSETREEPAIARVETLSPASRAK